MSLGVWWANQQILKTVNTMTAYVNAELDAEPVISLARRLVTVDGLRRRSALADALTIRSWLESVWKFVDDPTGREHLRTPVQLVADYQRLGYVPGDCDEAATLGAALAKAVGLTVEFVLFAFDNDGSGPEVFSHIFTVILTEHGGRVDLDVTRPVGPVPNPTRIATIEV